MKRFTAAFFAPIDRVFSDSSHFVGLKARLLATVAMVAMVLAPLNMIKLWWMAMPHAEMRIAFSTIILGAAGLALLLLRRGRLDLAADLFALLVVVPAHGLPLLAQYWGIVDQPLAMLLQVFAIDTVLLLLAFGFCTRGTALLVAAIIGVGQVLLHYAVEAEGALAGSLDFAADSLLREGLAALSLLFGIVFTIRIMLEMAHRRGEEALRATQALNDDLERLVARRTRDLERAMEEAAAAARVKSDFLANMSHEIRTPLNGIVATADLMRQRADVPDIVADEVRLIADSGELLLKLIDDILDFSKIEAGQLVLDAHDFALASTVADCVGLVATRAATGGVGLDWAVSPELPARCVGDSFRLRQVLLNLLANAVKFTRSGGQVTVRVLPAPTPAPRGRLAVRFEVSDTGIGMDEATLGRLFERFTQADSSTTRLYGGTGLGLAISARLVERMGGKLTAKSVEGKGSTFSFTLSLDEATTDGAVPVPPSKAAPESFGLHVMVAEDNPVNLKIISSQLKALGCRYSVATDGEAVLAALQRGPLPDLLLLDCHMPRLDGWEVARRLRSWVGDESALKRAASELPIVALTAAALAEERERCLEAGMNDFLAKPAKLGDLERVLRANRPAAVRPRESGA